jgi:hypothetical protein
VHIFYFIFINPKGGREEDARREAYDLLKALYGLVHLDACPFDLTKRYYMAHYSLPLSRGEGVCLSRLSLPPIALLFIFK